MTPAAARAKAKVAAVQRRCMAALDKELDHAVAVALDEIFAAFPELGRRVRENQECNDLQDHADNMGSEHGWKSPETARAFAVYSAARLALNISGTWGGPGLYPFNGRMVSPSEIQEADFNLRKLERMMAEWRAK